MIFALVAVRWISPDFNYLSEWQSRPIELMVILMVLAGVAYLFLVSQFRNTAHISTKTLTVAIAIGAALRLMWLGSDPILEDDTYRYFWDGALHSADLSPYLTAPASAISSPFSDVIDPRLVPIAENHPVDRVAYPYVTTIYPPVAQLFFWLHNMISPWCMDTWRLMLFAIECVSLFALLYLLRVYNKPDVFVLVYWFNPLFITETMNAGHMDVLLLPWLVLALVLLKLRGIWVTSIPIAIAAAIKIWPVILIPAFSRFRQVTLRKSVSFIVLTGVVTTLMLVPQLWSLDQPGTGLTEYATGWHTNAFLFSIINEVWMFAIDDDPGMHARLTVAASFLIIAIVALVRHTTEPARGMLVIIAAMFLLSPTGYPWYLIWMIPWLVLYPSLPLLILTATLPLYDLRFLDLEPWLLNASIALQFIPTLALLSLELGRTKT